MKLKTHQAIIFFILISLFTHCTIDDGDDNNSAEEEYAAYILNGETIDTQAGGTVISSFSTETVNGSLVGSLNIAIYNGIAYSEDGYRRVSITLPDYTVSSGTYDWDPSISATDPYTCSVFHEDTNKLLNNGTITITSNNGEYIEGTFNGTFENPSTGEVELILTDGSFRADSNPN